MSQLRAFLKILFGSKHLVLHVLAEELRKSPAVAFIRGRVCKGALGSFFVLRALCRGESMKPTELRRQILEPLISAHCTGSDCQHAAAFHSSNSSWIDLLKASAELCSFAV